MPTTQWLSIQTQPPSQIRFESIPETTQPDAAAPPSLHPSRPQNQPRNRTPHDNNQPRVSNLAIANTHINCIIIIIIAVNRSSDSNDYSYSLFSIASSVVNQQT